MCAVCLGFAGAFAEYGEITALPGECYLQVL
jgi:hypothetical protein